MIDEVFGEAEEIRESFGDFLRRHREASGKTIDGISRTTRIPKRYLQAFEDNDPAKLPEEAFARGFLRAYAGEIGLEIEDVISRYEKFRRSLMPTQIREVKKPAKVMLLGEGTEPRQVQQWLIWLLFGGVGLTVVIVGIIFLMRPSDSSGPSESMSSPTTTAPSAELPIVGEAETTGPTADAKAAQDAKAPSQPSMVVPVTPSILTIKALRDAKITIRLDENASQEIAMKQGDAQVMNVFREIEIRSSDKTAFTFQYNGKPLEVAGPVMKLFNRNLFNSKKP